MSTLRVIFVHGISEEIIKSDYSELLVQSLLNKLKNYKVIKQNATEDEVSKIITFENVNYSSIGQSEEDAVFREYQNDSSRLYNVADKIIEGIGFSNIRKQIITSVSDVLVYESLYWREHIRDTLREKIVPYINTNDPVTIVGHSLGSVVSFDTLYYNCRHNSSWCEKGFKAQNLFTFGSPIALFSLEREDKSGLSKPRYIPTIQMPHERDPKNSNPDMNFVKDNGVWYNFFDAQDFIGYPLETLFKDKFKVKDYLVQTGTLPLNAHIGYWKNDFISTKIAERLKIDWDNISTNTEVILD